MSATMIVILAISGTYVALNVRRVIRGRKWAFSFCQLAKEWEEREHARRVAARAQRRP
jgi:hypothetical protein